MPDTRPGIVFNPKGICQACLNYDKRQGIDWGKRFKELEVLCKKHKRISGYYDCLIAVSGGKDSHYLVYVMKEQMGMNPLLVSVAEPFTLTNAGKHNLLNLRDAFDCDLITLGMSIAALRKITEIGFRELGNPLGFVESAIYMAPIKFAVDFNIPLLVYGEDPAHERGDTDKVTGSALGHILRTFETVDIKFWLDRGLTKDELNMVTPSPQDDFKRVQPEPIFMSYYTLWSDFNHYQIAKRYGFKDLAHEWKREGNIEDFDQVDFFAHLAYLWLKYPKFGYARTTDIACRWIREGRITREKAVELVEEYDHKLDQRAMDDLIQFIGYTPRQFWDVVEGFWNRDIFEKVEGVWTIKRN